ncbi:MAG: Gfo/Idh/MocA family oxidoreductase [Candidatus Symbiothrix sp.]|jgi:virulence factor|nr:Gfo/Idh/MocA family oxidoreductase [Candidatus Symbiothrix sp.]
MNNLIDINKWVRKKKNLQTNYLSKYAFVGMGEHSLNNLYPVIDYLKIPLKYIVCETKSTIELIRQNYPSVIITDDCELVLNDPEISGLFISTVSSGHFELAKKALSYHKNVFVEVPACFSSYDLQILINIIKETKRACVVGMQKRFSTCTSILNQKLKGQHILSYNYRLLAGPYSGKNIYWDFFIHPIDLLIFLFGDANVISILETTQNEGQISLMLQLKHRMNITGTIEISTQYSSLQPKEELCVNTDKGFFEMKNHQLLTYTGKLDSILPLSEEKMFSYIPEKQYLFDGNNFLPVFRYNQLSTQGFLNEIQTFAGLCENRLSARNISSPDSLLKTFLIMESILLNK